MVELIKDFVRFDTVPSDLEGLYLITSVIIIFSIVIAFYFMISLVVSYVWSSFKLMKIFDNSARRSLRALSYIPLFNLSLFGVISRQKKGDEAHISFVALLLSFNLFFFFFFFVIYIVY